MARSNRGFASMDPAKHKEIARKGGKTTGARNLTTEARSRGGKASRRGSNSAM